MFQRAFTQMVKTKKLCTVHQVLRLSLDSFAFACICTLIFVTECSKLSFENLSGKQTQVISSIHRGCNECHEIVIVVVHVFIVMLLFIISFHVFSATVID